MGYPSMGYGGRLLGAIADGINYIGTEFCNTHMMVYKKYLKITVIHITNINYIDKVVKLMLKMKV